MKLIIDEREINIDVKYSDRKTYEIRIEPPDNIILKVPNKSTEKQIKQVLEHKSKWITTKLNILSEMGVKKVHKEFIDGELFLYLGKNYPLEIIYKDIKKPFVKLYAEKLFIYADTKDKIKLRESIKNWYREKALENILQRIEIFQKYIDIKPNAVKVKEQKKRWGSCSSRKNLMFNWRCIMAPLSILDYIVVHEMCHLVHMNHSKEFWQFVETIIPDYKEKRKWLKLNGFTLDI